MQNPKFYFEGGDLFYIELSIISFRNYINSVENNFSDQKKILAKKYAEHYKEVAQNSGDNKTEELNEIWSGATSQLLEIEKEFIQRFRRSIIIQIFSFLESELKNICISHSENTDSIYSVDDLKGNSDLEKVKKYLTKSMKIELGKMTIWPFINNLRLLRNKVVHNNSTIKIADNDLKAIKEFSLDNFSLESENPKPEFYNINFNNKEFINKCVNQVEIILLDVMKNYQSY
jgi:hypothetical protein